MGVVAKIQTVLGGLDTRTYRYQCGDCNADFEVENHDPYLIQCPECGTALLRSNG